MANAKAEQDVMEKIVSLCKRRGFIFQSSEIYGGLNSCWDYGPLGSELKRNVKEAWWNAVVRDREDVVGIDASILMHPRVWEASGHVAGFTDPLVDCKGCKKRFRADHIADIKRCPECGGELTEARQFNLMFKTFMGPVEEAAAVVFLRPETAQGIFVNFENVMTSARLKPPFGIAQIGKSFRNEITPGNFIFRTREFEQMEIEFFCKPGTDETWFDHWKAERFRWYTDLGIRAAKLRLRPHAQNELAHYAKACVDVEYEFPFGWSELEGIANRTDFDLKRHAEYSGKALEYFDQQTRERYVPYVIEPSAGVDRSLLTFLVDAFEEVVTEKGETERFLRLHPRLAPIKVAVLPLVNKAGMPELARQVFESMKKRFRCFYDDSGAIGRRYRRQDEAGTPYCVTVDGQSLEDNTVTVRYRDSREQPRVAIPELAAFVGEKLEGARSNIV
ncbi:MAG TPA: glycine--tRNA ligase [Planctomycetota bacterium]|nr:glycine--tRNA ligase [Planctomycetota bacterium]HRR82875.1 glycine--tRNA ligase [Planctomycetota bacterium]